MSQKTKVDETGLLPAVEFREVLIRRKGLKPGFGAMPRSTGSGDYDNRIREWLNEWTPFEETLIPIAGPYKNGRVLKISDNSQPSPVWVSSKHYEIPQRYLDLADRIREASRFNRVQLVESMAVPSDIRWELLNWATRQVKESGNVLRLLFERYRVSPRVILDELGALEGPFSLFARRTKIGRASAEMEGTKKGRKRFAESR